MPGLLASLKCRAGKAKNLSKIAFILAGDSVILPGHSLIEQKMQMDMFTMTESEINEKFWMIMCVSFVSLFVVIRISPYLQQ